jgi:hypothetical protein
VVESIHRLLLEELRRVHTELALQNTYHVFGLHKLLPKILLMQFLKGTAFGLGGVIGVAIVVSVMAFFLSQIDFIPIVGDWAKLIANEIKQ